MQLGLATDENNPQFVGAKNPDDLLNVQFNKEFIVNNFRSELEKRKIHDEVIFITISTPGNNLNIIKRPMYESDKYRFPRQWAIFQNENAENTRHSGTPLTEWSEIDRARAEDLKYLKFFTVEQLAQASDLQIQSIGLGGQELKQKAISFLERFSRVSEQSEIDRKNREIEELKAQMAELAKKIEGKPETTESISDVKPKRKYTKKAKVETPSE